MRHVGIIERLAGGPATRMRT